MNLLDILAEITFAELDPAQVESGIITKYEEITGNTLYPGDPVRLFLEDLAFQISLQNAALDTAGKQNLLAYAKGHHLDHLGAMVDTFRLSPQAATSVVRFEVAKLLDWPVEIPQGSRVATGEGRFVFAADHAATIEAGAAHVDVSVTAQSFGASANGLVPGQINKMVDPIAYVAKAHNIVTSKMGSDREEDEPYRLRIQLAPEHFSVAGPEGAYVYHTLSVHPDIAECAVWCPKPGFVDVRPLMKGGEMPSGEILAAVREKLSDKTIRPLTDTVIVAAPEPVLYEIRGAWFLRKSEQPLAESRKRQVAAALENFRLWQREKPGRDINPTRLISLLEQAGAKRVVLESPEFLELLGWQVARETFISLEFLGVEED